MRIKEIKVGLLALVGLGIAYLGFDYLKGNSIFNKGITFYSIYQDVEGLHVGSKVVLNGFPIGRVKNITFITGATGSLIAEYVVTDESVVIPANTVAQILGTDIFGSKAINLLIGGDSALALMGDTLVSEESEGMLAEVEKRLAPYEAKTSAILSHVDTLLLGVKITVATLNAMLIAERENLSQISGNVVSITQNLENNNKYISNSLKNMSDISDSLSQADVKKILDNANLAVESMKEAMDKINNGKGTMGKLMNDSSLYINLNQSALDLDLLLKDMKDHPKKYVHFSIWGGKDKEKDE